MIQDGVAVFPAWPCSMRRLRHPPSPGRTRRERMLVGKSAHVRSESTIGIGVLIE